MITFVEGTIEHLEASTVIINVGGMGYELKISQSTFSELKGKIKCRLTTHFHVKEDSQTLFGFWTAEERRVFRLLLSVSGVGPNTALMVLSSLALDEVKSAIQTEQVRTIQGVKGIGAKTAQRIIIDLKDKIGMSGDEIVAARASGGAPQDAISHEALGALTTLGIAKPAAQKSIQKVLKTHGSGISLEELIKLALKG